MLWPVVKKNRVIFGKFLVFSQSDGHGLAMWRYLIIVSPEPLLIKVTKDDNNN